MSERSATTRSFGVLKRTLTRALFLKRMVLVLCIHRVKWRHISVVAMRSPFCRSTRRSLLCVDKCWRFVAYINSNKNESVGLRKCPYYRYLIEKVTWYWRQTVRITNISQSLPPQNGGKQLIMKKLRHCHPMYNVRERSKLRHTLNG